MHGCCASGTGSRWNETASRDNTLVGRGAYDIEHTGRGRGGDGVCCAECGVAECDATRDPRQRGLVLRVVYSCCRGLCRIRGESLVAQAAPAGLTMSGLVSIVGAGPGDAGLLTVRGKELIDAADAIVYDALVNLVLLQADARATGAPELYYVGKRSDPDG